MKQYGIIVGKILKLLAAGCFLAISRDKKFRRELSEECDKTWYTIDRKELFRSLERLRLNKLINIIKQGDEEKISLTSFGKKRLSEYQIKNLKLKVEKSWDKIWRIVLFDIPENKKKIRDSFRQILKKLGFIEFQKSVFIYPYPCKDEINFIINFYNIYDCVYYVEAPISPDHKLKNKFDLN